MPHLTERISANIAYRYQIRTAPPSPATDGSVFEPLKTGQSVDDGVRERMKAEEGYQKKGENAVKKVK